MPGAASLGCASPQSFIPSLVQVVDFVYGFMIFGFMINHEYDYDYDYVTMIKFMVRTFRASRCWHDAWG